MDASTTTCLSVLLLVGIWLLSSFELLRIELLRTFEGMSVGHVCVHFWGVCTEGWKGYPAHVQLWWVLPVSPSGGSNSSARQGWVGDPLLRFLATVFKLETLESFLSSLCPLTLLTLGLSVSVPEVGPT